MHVLYVPHLGRYADQVRSDPVPTTQKAPPVFQVALNCITRQLLVQAPLKLATPANPVNYNILATALGNPNHGILPVPSA